jgi:hypothetical protein
MFLRFYGIGEPNVRKCMDKIVKLTNATRYTLGPMTMSCNPFVPPGENTEAMLYFKTKKELSAAYANPKVQALYKQACTQKGVEKKFVLRKPGDLAF